MLADQIREFRNKMKDNKVRVQNGVQSGVALDCNMACACPDGVGFSLFTLQILCTRTHFLPPTYIPSLDEGEFTVSIGVFEKA